MWCSSQYGESDEPDAICSGGNTLGWRDYGYFNDGDFADDLLNRLVSKLKEDDSHGKEGF